MDPARTALLIMDVQHEIVERFGDHGLTDRLVRAAASARAAGVRVIYVKVGFRQGHPEVSPRNPLLARVARRIRGRSLERVAPGAHAGAWGCGGDQAPRERVRGQRSRHGPEGRRNRCAGVERNRDQRLRAFDAPPGGRPRLLADRAFRRLHRQRPRVHRVLCEKVFRDQAEVLTTDEWIRRLT